MKTKTHLIILIFWLLSPLGVIRGQAQMSDAPSGTSATNISETQMTAFREKWENMPSADLLSAAKTDDAQAQYFYGHREWYSAREEADQAYYKEMAVWNQMSATERITTQARWEKAPEAEIRKAAEAGDLMAQYFLGGREDKYTVRGKQAFEWLRKSADQGFPPAEYEVAVCYLWESGWVLIGVNQTEGLELLQRSADHGWSLAQYKLGIYYLVGESFPRDLPKAIYYLQKAADQGGPRAQYALAQLYAQGIGEPRSAGDLPVVLLRKSASNGFNLALHALAERYRIGLGVPVNYIQAIQYYQAAREADEKAGEEPRRFGGDIFGLVNKSYLPNPEAGPVWSDFAMTLSIYLKATEQMDAEAMSQLAEWCLAGRFMPKDPVEACYWYSRAADQGALAAAMKRDLIRATLRPDQLERLEKLNMSTP